MIQASTANKEYRAIEKYRKALLSIPAPGGGCHCNLLGVANLGVLSGLDAETIFNDIRAAIPNGSRRVPDGEISDAINKALDDQGRGGFTFKSRLAPVVRDNEAAWNAIRSSARFNTEEELIASSPVNVGRYAPDDREMFKLFFENMFKPDDSVFIGDRHDAGILGETIRPAVQWLNDLWSGEKAGPFIIANPLSGKDVPKKTGTGETKRGDGNVAAFRYCLVEFDTRSRDDQIAFWSWMVDKGFPVRCLIDSGNKSIHGWLDVQAIANVRTLEDWDTNIKAGFYNTILAGLGVDAACSNASRLSRLPGYHREEKDKYQRLLWLSRRAEK